MKTTKIFLGGFNCSGKSTLADHLALSNPSIVICRGSQEFFKWLGLTQGDYAALEHLPPTYKDVELDKMISSLIHAAENDGVRYWLFTGHFGRINGAHLIPAMGKWVSKFDILILLTATQEDVLTRVRARKDAMSNSKKERRIILDLLNENINSMETMASLIQETEDVAETTAKEHNLPLLKLDSSKLNPSQLVTSVLTHLRIS